MKSLGVILLAVLTGCTSLPPKPIIQTRTVTVRVPVFVPLPDYLTTPPAIHVATVGDSWSYGLQCKAKLEAIRKLQPATSSSVSAGH